MDNKFEFGYNNEEEHKMLEHFKKIWDLRQDKGADYGNSWRSLGSKGQFVMLYTKANRLKNLVWDHPDRTPKHESVIDTLEDLINYCFHTILLIEEEKQ